MARASPALPLKLVSGFYWNTGKQTNKEGTARDELRRESGLVLLEASRQYEL